MCATRYYTPKTQSNHDSYIIPEIVEEFMGKPLYLLIAYWGLKLETPICQEQVAMAFGLTRKRAEQMMFYVHKKQDVIHSTLKTITKKQQKAQLRRLELSIYAVNAETSSSKKEPTPKMVKKMPHEERELWQQLLARSVGKQLRTLQ